MTRTLHLDYETASEVNLKTAGAHVYAAHKSTRILMLGWAFDEEPVRLWEPHKCALPPVELMQGFADPTVICEAANAQFERLITHYKLGVAVDYERWRCTLVKAYYLGFAGGLDQILEQAGLERKDARGQRWIQKFCTPAPSNHKADWYDWDTSPEDWAAFCEYCLQDVHTERQLSHYLDQFPRMHDWDWHQYFMDQRINDRGVPLDLDFAARAVELWKAERERLTAELARVSGLPKVTRDPFLAHLNSLVPHEPFNCLNGDYVASRKLRGDLPQSALELLDLWQMKEAKASTKYTAVMKCASSDGRARGMFQYKGASRTDRVGGRRLQLQNLKHPVIKDVERIMEFVECIKSGDREALQQRYGVNVSQALGGAVRHVIAAPPGKKLAVADLSSIESVVLGWVANCPLINQTFVSGKDSYKVFASQFYGLPYDQITKEMRTFCKPPVLGCFAADTEVLTDSGWKPIVHVTASDKVFDGGGYVSHGGVIDQGVKSVLHKYGVTATPDHLFYTGAGRWTKFEDLTGLKAVRAILMASGLWLSTSAKATGCVSAHAGQYSKTTEETSVQESQRDVSRAPTGCERKSDLARRLWAFLSQSTTDWLTGSTHNGLGVRTLATQYTTTMVEEGLSAASTLQSRQSPTSYLWKVGRTLRWKSTGLITTATTNPETCGSSGDPKTCLMSEPTAKCTTTDGDTRRPSSGENTAHSTETRAQSLVRLIKAFLPKGSSKSRHPAEVRTYDILNAGPRSRFMIRTSIGPMIVHNCGYMLGWFGLIAYAEGMGVQMAEAEARKAVETFRDMYPEIVKFWRWLYDSVKFVTRTGLPASGYRLHIERDAEFLRIRLPSGRNLSYHKPQILPQPAPWDHSQTVDNFTYMGMDTRRQWVRTSAHAGGVTENIVQSIASDILWGGITNGMHRGLDVVLHVHDEIVVESPTDRAQQDLQLLIDTMTTRPAWAPDMWLGADGFITDRYTKD